MMPGPPERADPTPHVPSASQQTKEFLEGLDPVYWVALNKVRDHVKQRESEENYRKIAPNIV